MDKMNLLINIIIIVKIIFIVLAVIYIYYNFKKKTTDPKAQKIKYWKERLEFIFVFLMSILLIILFNPRSNVKPLSFETRLLLYLFGIILLITADWNTFFTESPMFKKIQEILSNSKRF